MIGVLQKSSIATIFFMLLQLPCLKYLQKETKTQR